MRKKAIFYSFLKLILVLVVCAASFFSSYVYITVNELKLRISESQIRTSVVDHSISILEKDSFVGEWDLKNFLLFSKTQTPEIFLQNLLEENFLEQQKDKFYIKNKFELPKLLSNDCYRYRCIQNKVQFSEIPSNVWKALLGTEDFRFIEHRGVDFIAIARAVVVDIVAMKFVQGGSTLTQQLMKNLFLTSERKLSRKIKEIIYAVYIENILSKEDIITLYLNEVYWGTFQGIYLKGFYSASIAYFDKKPEELSEYEATILISLLKGPNYYSPANESKRIIDRAKAVYSRLVDINLMSGGSSVWNDKEWEAWFKNYKVRSEEEYFYSYYVTSKNFDLNLEPFEKYALFNSVYDIKRKLLRITKDEDIAIKIFVADLGCDDYDCKNSFSFYSKLEREKRKAITTESHQVGSLLKPIVYDSLIGLGRSYDEVVSTEDIVLNLKSGKWKPKDYSRAKEKRLTLKEALQKSKNIPLIRVSNEVGFDKLEAVLENKIPRLQKPLAQYPAQLLGAVELSLMELFQVYSKFFKEKCEEIRNESLNIEDTVLYFMSQASETTIRNLVRPPLKYSNVFGKTGTSNNGLDNWFLSFDGKRVYVFWLGVDSGREGVKLKLSGGGSAFKIFQSFINKRGKQISEIYCD